MGGRAGGTPPTRGPILTISTCDNVGLLAFFYTLYTLLKLLRVIWRVSLFSMEPTSSLFKAQLVKLRNDRDHADFTLKCQGKIIKAHSIILRMR